MIGKLYTNCLVAVLNNRQFDSRGGTGKALPSSSSSGVLSSQIQSLRDNRNNYDGSKISHTNASGGAVRIQVLQETHSDQDDLDFDSGTIPLETYKVRFHIPYPS